MSTAADDSHDENYISMAPSAAIRVKSHWTGEGAVACVQIVTLVTCTGLAAVCNVVHL